MDFPSSPTLKTFIPDISLSYLVISHVVSLSLSFGFHRLGPLGSRIHIVGLASLQKTEAEAACKGHVLSAACWEANYVGGEFDVVNCSYVVF